MLVRLQSRALRQLLTNAANLLVSKWLCVRTDTPPTFDGEQWQGDNMGRICLNRHGGFVNTLFLDWSARKVGLREFWVLKWHRQSDITGPWTKAGGASPEDWPEWMRSFKDH